MLKIKNFAKELLLLIKLHLIRNRKPLIKVIAAFVLICCFQYIEYGYKSAGRDILWLAIVVLSAVYALLISMNDYYRHNRSYTAQLLPATTKTKFVSEIIISLVIIPFVLISINTVIDCISFFVSDAEVYDCPFAQLGMGSADFIMIPLTIYFLVLANSWATLIKTRLNWTFIAMVAVSILAVAIMGYIGYMNDYPGVCCNFQPFDMSSYGGGWTKIEVKDSWASYTVSRLATIIWLWALPIASYIWAYFRFKEWESR